MNPQKRREIFARLAQANPNPTTELEYGTPFELLVAVVLSAQATDKSVNLATRKLFPRDAREDRRTWTSAAWRATSKASACTAPRRRTWSRCRSILLEEHGGEVPASREALERLPGVGRKTANVVLNTAFGQPTVAVDTHIFRVANRTGLAPGKDPLRSGAEAAQVHAAGVPEKRAPLADPARALRLPRAPPRLPRVPDPRPLRVPAEDERCSTRRAMT